MIADRAVREKVIKWRAGIRWDIVAEKSTEGYRGEPGRGDARRELREVQGRSRRNDEKKGNASVTKQYEFGEKHSRDIYAGD